MQNCVTEHIVNQKARSQDVDIITSCLLALLGTGFTYAMTSLGAATVFVFRGKQSQKMQSIFLGFASGVMMAASVWSLLIPAIEQAEGISKLPWIPVAGGFLIGGIFFYVLDVTLPHLNPDHNQSDNFKGIKKLFTAITLHNIPEGMAVGLSFALAVQEKSNSTILAAVTLAVGIGVQNFPEGAAVSLPLHQEGISKKRAFLWGSLSGIVEPIGGVVTVLLAGTIQYLLPWLLAFAAGAMIYVVVDELIPDARKDKKSNVGTIGAMAGFLIMMTLDVALG